MSPAVLYKTARLVTGLAFCSLFLQVSPAAAIDLLPYSLRAAWFIEDDGDPYWEIRVTCSDHETFRYMVRADESNPWCAKQAPELCSDRKLELAFELCKESYSNLIAERQQQKSLQAEEVVQQNELRTQLMQQAEKLQQQRENLNRQKAELQRRERSLTARERDLFERKRRLQQ